MPKMVEVVIDSVRVSLVNQQRIVVLREVDQERYLPIWIGPYEAEAITIGLQDIEIARPQTHDLIRNVLSAFTARLVRVEIVALREDVFYGSLVVEANGQTLEVDSRPSDALAMSVRYHVPIFVAEEVMDSAGMEPEEDAQGPAAGAEPSEPDAGAETEPAGPGADRNLSVFEDFLSGMDLDAPPPPEDPGDEPPDPDENQP